MFYKNQLKRVLLHLNCFKNVTVLLVLLNCLTSVVVCSESNKPPKLLIVSFGGLRWDYLNNITGLVNFDYLKNNGASARYVNSGKLTESLPSQWSIATGLLPNEHGMIQNNMYDRNMKKKFILAADKLSEMKKSNLWFGGNKNIEPIWITNQKASSNRLSASEWAGGEYFWGNQSSIWLPIFGFNSGKTNNHLIDQLIKLFTREKDPINFGAVYFDMLDKVGHEFGPSSNEMKKSIKSVDELILGYLIKQLKSHDILDELNLIVTSDHGMLDASKETAIYLNKFIDTSLFDNYGGEVVMNLFFKNSSDIQSAYSKFKNIKNISVYNKTQAPERLNFNNHSRNGDLILIADVGYAIYLNEKSKLLKGVHGYGKESAMNSIFIGKGPRFKMHYKSDSFRNVDIYPLMCEILKITPNANNGSLANVIKLLKPKRNIKLYIALSVTPVILSFLAAVFLGFMQFRQDKNETSATNQSVNYQMLSMNENDNSLSDSDGSENELFSKL